MRTNFYAKWKGIFIVLSTIFYFGVQGQTVSKFILTDQFGYRPEAKKTAVIKNPKIGFDAGTSFSPGSAYRVINAVSQASVYEGGLTQFNGGVTDAASGDQIWYFDFSSVTEPGKYYILDVANNVKSYNFSISGNIYNEVLKHAVRTFFYQRAGYEKSAQYAGAEWADGASHIGYLQDKNCRLYNQSNNASTERDLHGGWYDAGDYNKYTSWTCSYVESMMLAYLENPEIWTDDYNIPESGNGIPDLLDEAKWGLDWVLRMQEPNGSVLSVMGLSHASPPSSATGQSLYGPATAAASWSAAKAFAISYKVYKQIGMTEYAEQLKTAAIRAWNWAEQNPDALFFNSGIIAAGEQEIEKPNPNDAYAYDGRSALRIAAALYLYEITGESSYHTVFTGNYQKLQIFLWGNNVQHYWASDYFMLFYYLGLEGGNATVKNNIETAFRTGFNKSDNYAGMLGKDGYRSFAKAYDWGSNAHKSNYGSTFYFLADKSLEPAKNDLYYAAAEDYLHYIHGVNPLGMVYLSNMNNYGASSSVTEFYHSWFAHGSAWDELPAPGFLPGGPNEYYTWDGCCPNNCRSNENNAMCLSEEIPNGQPAAKMYKNFNTAWPLNSWQITENSGGYQMAYIRLLSKFVAIEVESEESTLLADCETTETNVCTAWFDYFDTEGSLIICDKEPDGAILMTQGGAAQGNGCVSVNFTTVAQGYWPNANYDAWGVGFGFDLNPARTPVDLTDARYVSFYHKGAAGSVQIATSQYRTSFSANIGAHENWTLVKVPLSSMRIGYGDDEGAMLTDLSGVLAIQFQISGEAEEKSGTFSIDHVQLIGKTLDISPCNETTHITTTENTAFVIYPNPAKDGNFNVTLPNSKTAVLTIINLQGQAVYSTVINNGFASININPGAGLYIVSVQSESGLKTQKLVIK